MFSSLGWPEVAVLILVALVIFGPDRLPGAVKQAGTALRSAREMLTGARKQMKDEFGDVMPDFDPSMLSPKAFVRKHLLEDFNLDDEPVKPAVNAMEDATPPRVTAPQPPTPDLTSPEQTTPGPTTSGNGTSATGVTAPPVPSATGVTAPSGNGAAPANGAASPSNGVTSPLPPPLNGTVRPAFVPVSMAAVTPIAAGKSPVVISATGTPSTPPPAAAPATPYDDETT